MRVLVACEFSGIVRDAFAARGHDAWSCDLLPTERPGQHIQADVLKVLDWGWELIVGHPDCRLLCNSGIKWLYMGGKKESGRDPERWRQMRASAEFFLKLLNAPAPRVAIENPVMHPYAKEIVGVRQAQTVQPWWFGHGETKATCLWLKGLPKLTPTEVVAGRFPRVHREPRGPERWKNRSRTYPGLAQAMASQWGVESAQVGLFETAA